MVVDVGYVVGQRVLEVAALRISILSSSSRRKVPIHRSVIAFAWALVPMCGGWGCLVGEHVIDDAGDLAVASPDQEPEARYAIAEVYQQVPCLLGNPGSAGIRRGG
jgi:hypothetical protein